MMIRKNMAFDPNQATDVKSKLKKFSLLNGGPNGVTLSRAVHTQSSVSHENHSKSRSNLGTDRLRNNNESNLNSSEKSFTQGSDKYKKFLTQGYMDKNKANKAPMQSIKNHWWSK